MNSNQPASQPIQDGVQTLKSYCIKIGNRGTSPGTDHPLKTDAIRMRLLNPLSNAITDEKKFNVQSMVFTRDGSTNALINASTRDSWQV